MPSDYNRGVYGKYKIEKADGTPCDPEACYFVLRLDRDTDDAARDAMRTYVRLCGNKKLARDIRACIVEIDRANLAFARSGFNSIYVPPLKDPIWRYGEPTEQSADELPELDID